MENKKLLRVTAWLVSAGFYITLFVTVVVLPIAALSNRLNYSLPIDGAIGDLPNKMVYGIWMRAQVSHAQVIFYDWPSFRVLLSKPAGLTLAGLTGLRVIAYLLTMWWLKQLFDTMLRHTVFHPVVSTRIRRIALTMLLLPCLTFASQFVSFEFMRQYSDQLGAAYSFHHVSNLPLTTLLPGALLLVLAQIFHYGTQLQQEQDLTI